MDIFTGLGLAAPAGLNAYIPLLTVGLLARFTDLITLEAPYDILASDAGLIILTILLAVEIFADAIPGLDHVNDVLQTVIRPAAGGVVMLASDGAIVDLHPVLAATTGILLAGSVHAVKALGRPMVTASTSGFGNPVVSGIENVAALILSLMAILAPVAILLLLLMLLVIGLRWLLRRSRLRAT
jgi:hypothetical protein